MLHTLKAGHTTRQMPVMTRGTRSASPCRLL